MSYKIFISASYKDRALARDLMKRLREAGVSVAHSESALSAGSPDEKIFMRLLKDADEMIVLLTNNSVDDFWRMFEIGAASSLRKQITPVIVGLEETELPPVIRQLKYIGYDQLSKYISTIEKRAKAA